MEKFLVIAYFMHQHEDTLIRNNLDISKSTDSFYVGEITGQQLATLNGSGIITNILNTYNEQFIDARIALEFEDSVTEAWLERSVEDPQSESWVPEYNIRTQQMRFPSFYKFSSAGPLVEDEIAQLSDLGLSILESISHETYLVRIESKSQYRQLNRLEFVQNLLSYNTSDTADRSLIKRRDTKEGKVLVNGEFYDILLHRKEDLREFLHWLSELAVIVARSAGMKVRIMLFENLQLLNEITAHPMVKFISHHTPPKLHNDHAAVLIGVNKIRHGAGTSIGGYKGEGEIIGVADTGIDSKHPDLVNQLAGLSAWGRTGDTSDPHGHGTHVAGSIAGDGSASSGTISGMAPEAKIYFQSLLDDDDTIQLPLELKDLFEEAYLAGARIHNNSWGSSTASKYTASALEVDEFAYERKDMLLVFSAGNDGSASTFNNVPQGYVDYSSIGSPASAKNVLTVGASRSTRNSGGFSKRTYNQVWPKSFPHPPYYTVETVSGNAECLAGFSSRGPCDDMRIKPDVVAPGTDIISTRSAEAGLSSFWGILSSYPLYALMGGTSMSAPIVSGFVALVREYYRKVHNHAPSAALLKATVINGCRMLNGDDSILTHPKVPNWNQGFGQVDSSKTIPAGSDTFFMHYVDNYLDPASQFRTPGQKIQLQFSVHEGHWIRVCLAYTDFPARALQNNLNLIADSGTVKWLGNAEAPSMLKGFDTTNNVETISIDNAAPGVYTVQVMASNLIKPPQDFALVIASSDTSITINQL